MRVIGSQRADPVVEHRFEGKESATDVARPRGPTREFVPGAEGMRVIAAERADLVVEQCRELGERGADITGFRAPVGDLVPARTPLTRACSGSSTRPHASSAMTAVPGALREVVQDGRRREHRGGDAVGVEHGRDVQQRSCQRDRLVSQVRLRWTM
nr:hypothetical protein [Actinokineospora cianjurensis]